MSGEAVKDTISWWPDSFSTLRFLETFTLTFQFLVSIFLSSSTKTGAFFSSVEISFDPISKRKRNSFVEDKKSILRKQPSDSCL